MSYRALHPVALALGLPALVLAGLLAARSTAHAQAAPPGVPTTYYGNASGATAGETVNAYVVSGGVETKCGDATTFTSEGVVVYVVNVAAADPARPGCGAAGRQVRLGFKKGVELERRSNETANWLEAGSTGYRGVKFDVSVGPPPALERRALVPLLAKSQ